MSEIIQDLCATIDRRLEGSGLSFALVLFKPGQEKRMEGIALCCHPAFQDKAPEAARTASVAFEIMRRHGAKSGHLDPRDLHNVVAPAALRVLCNPIIESASSGVDLMVALESVVAGAFKMAVHLGGDDIVLETFVEGVRARLADDRLRETQPAGSA